MAKTLKDDKPKIQMLLDVENIFGESTRGLGQFILTLLVVIAPVAIIAYTALYIIIPWQILAVFCLIWAVRMTLIIMGHESQRLRDYKRQRDDVYALSEKMCRIRNIHPQGCIEYVNGTIGFFVVTYNDSSGDIEKKSIQIDRFLNLAVGKHPFDIYVQNVTDTGALTKKYENVQLFGDSQAAGDFMEIIDYVSKAVESSSKLTRNIIFIQGSKWQWKDIQTDIQTALSSEAARVFRLAYLVTDKDEITNIVSRDIDGYVDIEALTQKQYYTGNTRGAKVISYNYSDKEEAKEEEYVEQENLTSFIPQMK